MKWSQKLKLGSVVEISILLTTISQQNVANNGMPLPATQTKPQKQTKHLNLEYSEQTSIPGSVAVDMTTSIILYYIVFIDFAFLSVVSVEFWHTVYVSWLVQTLSGFLLVAFYYQPPIIGI